MQTINVQTRSKDELVDITYEIKKAVSTSGIREGICTIFTPHTTAAITINENADPDVRTDFIKGLNALSFENINFRHAEGNSPAHIKSSLVGCSESVIIDKGDLVLGIWQGIYFCEFDGPRSRKVNIMIK